MHFKVGKSRIKEMGFEVFPERCDRGAISYLEGEGVPENWGIVTERIGENVHFKLFIFKKYVSYGKIFILIYILAL